MAKIKRNNPHKQNKQRPEKNIINGPAKTSLAKPPAGELNAAPPAPMALQAPELQAAAPQAVESQAPGLIPAAPQAPETQADRSQMMRGEANRPQLAGLQGTVPQETGPQITPSQSTAPQATISQAAEAQAAGSPASEPQITRVQAARSQAPRSVAAEAPTTELQATGRKARAAQSRIAQPAAARYRKRDMLTPQQGRARGPQPRLAKAASSKDSQHKGGKERQVAGPVPEQPAAGPVPGRQAAGPVPGRQAAGPTAEQRAPEPIVSCAPGAAVPREQLIAIARIGGVFGLRGEVKLTSFSEDPCAILSYAPLLDGQMMPYHIESQRWHKGQLLVKFAHIKDRDKAQELAHKMLYIKRSQLAQLEGEDEFYHADLLGLQILLENEEDLVNIAPNKQALGAQSLGQVTQIVNFGAGDLLEIKLKGGEKLFIPFSKEMVPSIALEGNYLIISRRALCFFSQKSLAKLQLDSV